MTNILDHVPYATQYEQASHEQIKQFIASLSFEGAKHLALEYGQLDEHLEDASESEDTGLQEENDFFSNVGVASDPRVLKSVNVFRYSSFDPSQWKSWNPWDCLSTAWEGGSASDDGVSFGFSAKQFIELDDAAMKKKYGKRIFKVEVSEAVEFFYDGDRERQVAFPKDAIVSIVEVDNRLQPKKTFTAAEVDSVRQSLGAAMSPIEIVREIALQGNLHDAYIGYSQCRDFCDAAVLFLREHGIDATPKVGTVQYQRDMSGHEAGDTVKHGFFEADGLCYDFTLRQFDPSYPFPHEGDAPHPSVSDVSDAGEPQMDDGSEFWYDQMCELVGAEVTAWSQFRRWDIDFEQNEPEEIHDALKRIKSALILDTFYDQLTPQEQRRADKAYDRIDIPEILDYVGLYLYQEFMRSARFSAVLQKIVDAKDRAGETAALSLALNAMHSSGHIISDYVGLLDYSDIETLSHIPQEEIDAYREGLTGRKIGADVDSDEAEAALDDIKLSPTQKAMLADTKVLRNGKPMVVYHGTIGMHKRLSPKLNGKGEYGKGIYFTENAKEASDDYSMKLEDLRDDSPALVKKANTHIAFLNVTNPCDVTNAEHGRKVVAEISKTGIRVHNGAQYLTRKVTLTLEDVKKEDARDTSGRSNHAIAPDDWYVKLQQYLYRVGGHTTSESLNTLIQRLGFDGVRIPASGWWVAFQSKQVVPALWHADASKEVAAGLSPILYHHTSTGNALAILTDNQFKLTSNLGTDADQVGKQGKSFYLSTSRIKYGGYNRSKSGGVSFVLNGKKLAYNHGGASVDYWGSEWRESSLKNSTESFLRFDENEDRVVTDKSVIAPADKFISEIHIMSMQQDQLGETWATYEMQRIRRLLLVASRRGVPAFVYDDKEAWAHQNKAKAKKYADLTGAKLGSPEELEKYKQFPHKSGFKPYFELYYAMDWKSVSEQTKDLLRYLYAASHFETRLKELVHNSKVDVKNHGDVAKLVQLMRKAKTKTIKEFSVVLSDRIRKLQKEANASTVQENEDSDLTDSIDDLEADAFSEGFPFAETLNLTAPEQLPPPGPNDGYPRERTWTQKILSQYRTRKSSH